MLPNYEEILAKTTLLRKSSAHCARSDLNMLWT